MSKRQRFLVLCRRLSQPARSVLRLGMLAVALQACVLAIVVHDTWMSNPLYVGLYYPPTVEFISASFTIVVCGAILFDITHHQMK